MEIDFDKIPVFVRLCSKAVSPTEMSPGIRLIEMEGTSLTLRLLNKKLLLGGFRHPGVKYRAVHQQAAARPQSNYAAVSHGTVTRGGDPILSRISKTGGGRRDTVNKDGKNKETNRRVSRRDMGKRNSKE